MASLQTTLVLEQTSPPPARQWTVTGSRLTIGRDPDSDVAVDDPLVSRHHADLFHVDGTWSLVDSGRSTARTSTAPGEHDRGTPGRPHPDRSTASWCSPAWNSGSPRRAACEPPPPPPPPPPPAVTYNVPSQHGTNYNVAGNQYTTSSGSSTGTARSRTSPTGAAWPSSSWSGASCSTSPERRSARRHPLLPEGGLRCHRLAELRAARPPGRVRPHVRGGRPHLVGGRRPVHLRTHREERRQAAETTTGGGPPWQTTSGT